MTTDVSARSHPNTAEEGLLIKGPFTKVRVTYREVSSSNQQPVETEELLPSPISGASPRRGGRGC